MGSCASVQKSSSASGSSVKHVPGNLIAPSSTFVTHDVIFPARIDPAHPRSDSKEEMFFDSRAWLDSDCEDDFVSVDGEFTPSRGTTPVHHKFTMETERSELSCGEQAESPTDNKKRLVELFRETNMEEEEAEETKVRTCLWVRTPVRSSAPATPSGSHRRIGGCVPRLVSCSSFRRKIMSPHAVVH